MGVATKRRRKIIVGDRQYIWYVCEDEGAAGLILNVISNDKQFIAKYQLDQPEGQEYVVILGRLFAGAVTGRCWKRFFCPRFAEHSVASKNVRELIEWCLDESLERHPAEWRRSPWGK